MIFLVLTMQKNYLQMHYNLYRASDLRKIVNFFREIESIKFECNAFVLVLVQIDLIHVEHTKCISSISIKTNRNLFLFLINTLLLYIPCLALTDGETNTLTSRGLEEPFFQLCCCVVSVFGSGGKCGTLF